VAPNAAAAATTIIKPGDLVRTVDAARTARVLAILPCGLRHLLDVHSGRSFKKHVNELYLLEAAVPQPWPSRRSSY
jgi:hypothetical protein